jgi:hypothetical protein
MNYLDRTLCEGGTPLCAKFSSCPRAFTAEHQARAKALGLPATLFEAPACMPCYVDPAAPKQPPPRATRFPMASVPESRWRELFSSRPMLTNMQIARLIGCSNVSVGTVRRRMGFDAYPAGGHYRRTRCRADAEKLAKQRRPGETLIALAGRVGLTEGQIYHIANTNRDLFPAKPGNAGRSRR